MQSVLKLIFKADWDLIWKNFKGKTNETCMVTLRKMMSENITTSKHTVLYLVHKRMKTMNKPIDQPIQFDKPKGLKNNLVKIQENYRRIEKFIIDFDNSIEKRRLHPTLEALERYQLERYQERRTAPPMAEEPVVPNAEQRPQPPSNENVTPPAPKRRRIVPNRLNIASTKGHSYQ